MTLIIAQFFNVVIFANEADRYQVIQGVIGESIEWKYINKTSVFITSSFIRHYDEQERDEISVYIYFNAGVYAQKTYFDSLVEDTLLPELKKVFQDYDVSVSLLYPFNITLAHNHNYDLDKRQSIIKEIHKDTFGIIIENLFQNTLVGYFEDNYFCNLPESNSRVRQLLHNNFNKLLEIVLKYFDAGNIVSF
jgi:hypothetical protein